MKRAAILAACLVGFACFGVQAAPSTSADQQAKLKQLKARISKLEASTDRDVQTRGRVYAKLRASEQQIAQSSASSHKLKSALDRAQTELAGLKRQQARAQTKLDTQKTTLAKQIRAAYVQGQTPELELLLNAKDPTTLERMLTYYQYLDRARAADIQALRVDLKTLSRLNDRVQAQVTALAKLKEQRSAELAKLEHTRNARQHLLAQLDTRIHGHKAQLAQMRDAARDLENLLAKLQQTLSDIPANLEGERRFASLKGRLPWPVSGHIIQHFGAPLAGGRLHAQGDLITAPLGTPVHVISYGRVVFSDWLPHFGLLVIVDHGDGYMSIYAHNQSVYVRVGDWVKMGETIATLGDSGGQNQPALYFAIRHRKAALSPRAWCRGLNAGG